MYFVYKITLKEYNATYVGCSCNVKNRISKHNDAARKETTFFGKFLKDHGIKLNYSDAEIIAEFEDRHEALTFERETTLAMNGTDVFVLNNNYSDHCTRVGLFGKDNPFSKVYVVVDMKTHTFETVDDMHVWVKSHNGTEYKNLIGTSKRKPYVHKNRYVARELNEWNSLNEQEKEALISGEWYKRHLENNRENHIKKASKTYLVQMPNGDKVEVTNLDKFAREHGINDGNLHASLTSNKSASGYKVLKRLS